jgi:hypothetical protein
LIQKKQDCLSVLRTSWLLEGNLRPQTTVWLQNNSLHEEQKLVRNCSSLFRFKSILFPAQTIVWTMSSAYSHNPCRVQRHYSG